METRASKRKRLETATGQPEIAEPPPPPPEPSAPGSRLLDNDLIVSKIAKHLPPKTLLALRPTCTNWNRVFVPHIRQQGHVPITIECHFEKDPTTKIRTYTELMLKSRQIPFSEYKLELHECSPTLDIFTHFGHSITSLDLSGGWYRHGMHQIIDVRMVRQIIFHQAPNLRHLELNFILGNAPISGNLATLSAPPQLPNLKRIGFRWNAHGYDELHPWLLSLLNDIIRSVGLEFLLLGGHTWISNLAVATSLRDFAPHIDKLKNLTIAAVNSSELAILIEISRRKDRPLRLEQFDTTFRYNGENRAETARLLHEFLRQQSSHLRQFSMKSYYFANYNLSNDIVGIPLWIPRMVNLLSFKFTGAGLKYWNVQFEDGSLRHSFPKLQTFKCKKRGLGKSGLDYLADPNVLQHGGVTELKFNTRITQPETLLQFGQFYSSVVHAEVLLNKCTDSTLETFSFVFAAWPLLQTLSLYCEPEPYGATVNFDGLVSGVRAIHLEELKKGLGRQTLNWDRVRALQRKYKTLPGLSDLRHLRKFSIQMEEDMRAYANISDVGGCLGFAMASPTLQYMRCSPKYTTYMLRHRKDPDAFRGNAMSLECKSFIRSSLGPAVYIQFD